ncbi:DUF262 domain-containing protein [Nocardia sp. NPDC057353]|uniref:DUF262 domain-containing protein n=1 Tax=Nocardia sp. NPDC057353 TaxID=3346104 RepID=UPI00363863D3
MTSLQDQIEAARQTIRSDALAMSVGEVANLYRNSEIVIRPEFQRLFRWDISQKARLIESLLLGIPVPSIFVMQRDDGIWEVIDGLQRISTILEFMGELRNESTKELDPPSVLVGTKYLPSLKGMAYEEDTANASHSFTPGQRLALKRAKLDVKILLPESNENSKFELFDRLNTGGSPLSAQEIRNTQLLMRDASLYKWLEGLRTSEEFKDTIPITDRLLQEAYDMELVCRFFALLRSGEAELRGIENLDTFLSDKIFETIDSHGFDRGDEASRFKRTFTLLRDTLGEDSFKKYDRGRFLGAFSVSAFETISIGIGENIDKWERREGRRPGAVQAHIQQWWSNDNFRAGSRGGIRPSTRLAKTLPEARSYFKI